MFPPPHRYENCEMRTVVLSDGGGGGVADMTWFPGGHAATEPQEVRRAHPLALPLCLGGGARCFELGG